MHDYSPNNSKLAEKVGFKEQAVTNFKPLNAIVLNLKIVV